MEQGAKLSSLMIVRSGVAVVSRREDGRDIELARLSPGDCFGEGGVLMGTKEIGSIRAMVKKDRRNREPVDLAGAATCLHHAASAELRARSAAPPAA